MNDLKVFSNEEFGEVRTVFENGEAWFCGKDVQNALEYSKSSTPSVLFGAVPEKWKGIKRIDTPGGEQNMLFLSEQGVYFFLGRSDKPKALPYQMYIAGEVAPSIRKYGAYMTDDVLQKALSDPRSIAKILNDLADEREARLAAESKSEKLESENAVMAPKAEYYDLVCEYGDNISFTKAAQEIGFPRNRLIHALEEHGYLYRDFHGRLLPYAGRNDGLFAVKEWVNEERGKSGFQTLVTPKGKQTFLRLLKRWGLKES